MRIASFMLALTYGAVIASGSAWAAADPLLPEQWNLRAVHALEAQRISTGAGATVAVVDSGVEAAHPDLAGNVLAGPDVIDGDRVPDDENGHGTNVAGIIAAHAGNGLGTVGAAPQAKVLAIRVLDATKRGTTTQEARGIDAAVAAGAQVINLSLSAGPAAAVQLLPDNDLVQAIDRAARAGVVVVASAGNDNVPVCAQPLIARRILCVGAINRAGQRAYYSNHTLRVDLVAPGGEATDGGAIPGPARGGGYSAMAGTSQAAPHVAAAAALLVSLGLRGDEVIDRIVRTAAPIGRDGQSAVFGHGLLDMAAAVQGLGPVRSAVAARLALRVRARQRARALMRRGLLVGCRADRAGTCTVEVTSRSGRLLARGSAVVAPQVTATIRARPTRAGRRALRRARRMRLTVRVTMPGAEPARTRITAVAAR